MGLNVNYRLLMEGANSKYELPSYRPMESMKVFSEAYMIDLFSEFNREIIESRNMLNSIYGDSDDLTVYTESSMFTTIINGIKTIIDKVITGVRNIMNGIINFFKQILRTIKTSISNKKDTVESKYRPYELTRVLSNALNLASVDEKKVMISDIHPTADLLDKNFPDTSIIGSSLVTSTVNSMKLYVADWYSKNGDRNYNIDAEAAESLADHLHDQEDSIAQQILGKYYSNNAFADINSSIDSVAIKAFGSEKSSDVILSVDLYNLAVDNLSRSKEVIDSLEKSISDVQKNYNNIMSTLTKAKEDILKMDKNIPNYDVDMRKGFNDAARRAVTALNRILNIIQKAVEADYKLLVKKGKRIYQIYDPVPTSTSGDSMRVKQACHNLILKYVESQPQQESTISYLEASVESARMMEEFDSVMSLLDEAYLEEEYNEIVTTVLNEADGNDNNPNSTGGNATGNNSSSAQQSTASQNGSSNNQQASQQQNQNTAQRNNSSTNNGVLSQIGKAIDTIVENFLNMLTKFKNRIGELIAQNVDGAFWNKNRQKISSLTFADSTVNQWHVYDIKAFKTSICDETTFDVNAPYLDSDEAMQNKIIEKILGGNRSADTVNSKDEKNNSFSKRISRAFESNYIDNPGENAGVKLGSGNIFNPKESFDFVDDFVRNGFNGESLGSIEKDSEKIKTLHKNVKSSMQTIVDQFHDDYAKKSGGADNTNTEPVKNESSSYEFNLADHFGLCNPQPLMELDVQIASDDAQTTDKNAGAYRSDATKRATDRVNRYFKYSTYALTSKMTTALAAYKQYMTLYKAAYKQTPKAQNNDNKNSQAPEQNNTENKK